MTTSVTSIDSVIGILVSSASASPAPLAATTA
jgi:hypothetical protein